MLRLLSGSALIYFGITFIHEGPSPLIVVLQGIGIACGLVLLVGLFTPVAGAVAAITKLCIAIARLSSGSGDPWIALTQAVLAAALAMIGPGAFSIDARQFGRKHIDLSDR